MIEVISANVKRWRFGKYTKEIIELLYWEGGLPAPIIAEKLDKDYHFIYKYLKELERRGLASRDEFGIWHLSEFARKNIERIRGA